jgi:uncharacterized RDD family membrane protein YckC
MGRNPESLMIQTPEQVGFEYALAGVGTRATAFLIDTAIRGLSIIFLVVALILLARLLRIGDPFLMFEAPPKSWTWLVALALLFYGVVDLGYFLLFEALWNGQTPGKRLQRIRVIRLNGQPIGWLESSIRNILRAVDMWAGLYPLGLLVMFLSPRCQRIGDYAAGTVVVLEPRKAVPAGQMAQDPVAPVQIPDMELHISTLAPQEYRLLKAFLQRRQGMDPAHRSRVARTVAHRLMRRWGIPSRAGLSYESLLETVVEAYERSRRAL